MAITFEVNQVQLAEQPLRTIPAVELWSTLSKPKPEAYSPGQFVRTGLSPMVGAIGHAYNGHRPLSISPDSIWVTIAQGLAKHIGAHAEQLRSHFVKHEGKKYLEIRRDNFKKGSLDNDWPGAFSEFSDKLSEHIGKKRDLIVSNFSTTTPLSKTSSEIVLMEAMQSYFRYGMMTMCGFPSITLEGTAEDWKSVLSRVQMFDEFGLSWWTRHLVPILEKMVATAQGSIDLGFWNNLYKEGGGSGGPYITGWINTLFPYLREHGKGPRLNQDVDWQKQHGWAAGPHPDDFPSGLSSAPMLWHYLGTTFPMRLIGGLAGISQASDGTLRPEFGWAVSDDPEAVNDHACESESPLEYDSFCKHCGRRLSNEQVREAAQGERQKGVK